MSRRLILRIAFCVVWSVFAAELFLRVMHPVPMLPRYVQSTPYGIRGNMPETEYWHSTPDYKIEVRTNEHGMRADNPIPFEKPENTKRIVMLGDSFGMGFGATAEQTFLSQLKQNLSEAGETVDTLNLCVSGHGNAEQLIELKNRGIKFDPDIVLVAWHHSDLDDNIRSGLFKLENDQLVRAHKSYLPGTKIAERLFRNRAYRWLAGNCQLYTWSREKASSVAQQAMLNLRPTKAVRKSLQHAKKGQEESKRGSNYPDRLSLALLTEMKRVTEEHGAKFVIVIVPRRYNRVLFATDFPIEVAEASPELDIVNPLPRFEKHSGELIYWEQSHFHFTPLGNRIVGQAIAEHILEHDLLGQ